jgi:NADH-quinone oxidoreductase subunit M
MNEFPWLSLAVLLPILGAVVVALLPAGRGALPKQVALGFSLLTLAVVAVVGLGFEAGGARYQFTETHEWIGVFGAHYAVGVDGIGLTLVLMTAILSPVVILASWYDGDGGRWHANAFFAWMLALEGLSVLVFSATDVFLFYVIFEAVRRTCSRS